MKDIKTGECDKFGFYQGNYFCEVCEKLTPTQRLKCAKLTRDNVLNGTITEDMVKELGYDSLK